MADLETTSLRLREIVIIERDPMPGVDLHLVASQCREAVGEADVGGLGIADALVGIEYLLLISIKRVIVFF